MKKRNKNPNHFTFIMSICVKVIFIMFKLYFLDYNLILERRNCSNILLLGWVSKHVLVFQDKYIRLFWVISLNLKIVLRYPNVVRKNCTIKCWSEISKPFPKTEIFMILRKFLSQKFPVFDPLRRSIWPLRRLIARDWMEYKKYIYIYNPLTHRVYTS